MISRESGLYVVRSAIEMAQQNIDATTAEYLAKVLSTAPKFVYNIDLEGGAGLTVFQQQQLIRLRVLADPLSQIAILGTPKVPMSDQNYREPNPILGELSFAEAQLTRGLTTGWRRDIDITVPIRCISGVQLAPSP